MPPSPFIDAPPSGPQPRSFDALIIGGGPAGLTAAIYLARFRRRVVVVDEGRSRALRIPCTHNYPGFPQGIAGVDLVTAMREQACRHGVEFAQARVAALAKTAEGFEATLAPADASDGDDRSVKATTTLLATGASDVEPDMPHLIEAIEEGALRYCPVCDGHEVIDQWVGVLTNGPAGVQEALYLRHFTDRVILFSTSADLRFAPADLDRLAEAGVKVAGHHAHRVRLVDGRIEIAHGDQFTVCDSLYGSLGLKVHSDLARSVGADHDDHGYVLTDRHQATSVPGLYAAGDVVKGLNQMTVAAGGAAVAASAMHLILPSPVQRTL